MPSSTRKRRISGSGSVDEPNDDYVPIPIQFFFWNQTSLFIKKKFGKLTEAHAMNFEKVLVQNILHGLSPGLSDAINSISRWAFIKSSFPHILHACATTLVYRRENLNGVRLNKTETKLLYTLHWLILDAASECEDAAATQKLKNKPVAKKQKSDDKSNRQALSNNYLHSVSTIQLFVYLFIPILKSLKPEDLDNLKLSNGLKIWEPLWAYRQPSIPIFSTPVKQRQSPHLLCHQEALDQSQAKEAECAYTPNSSDIAQAGKTNEGLSVVKRNSTAQNISSSFGDIYMGDTKSSPLAKQLSTGRETRMDSGSINNSASEMSNLSQLTGVCNKKKLSVSSDDRAELNTLSSFKYSIGKSDMTLGESSEISNIPSDNNSHSRLELTEQATLTACNRRAPLVQMSSICSYSDSTTSLTLTNTNSNQMLQNTNMNAPRPALTQIAEQAQAYHDINIIISEDQSPLGIVDPQPDMTRNATFFDVAVMRCLLSSKWHSEGYVWALEYLGHRVSEITDHVLKEQDIYLKLHKSISVPTRLNELSIMTGLASADGETGVAAAAAEMLIYDARADRSTNQFVELINQISGENDFTNLKYTLGNYYDHSKRKKYLANYHNRIRRIKYIDADLQPRKFQSKGQAQQQQPGTSTGKELSSLPTTPFTFNELQTLNLEDTAFKNYLKKDQRTASKNQSAEWPSDRLTKVARSLYQRSKDKENQSGLASSREISFSDTHINYQANYKDVEEAPGSSGLINLDGSLNLNIVLKGLHSVILKENSLKLCELTLYILENLMNIDIMPSEEIDAKLAHAKKNLSLSPSSVAYLDDLEVKYNENFYLATDVALRNIKWLGCFNCHANSKTFLNEQLRGKIKLLLGRLHAKNARRFKEFFRTFVQESDVNYIMETFHALLGYCHDPHLDYGHYYPYVNIKTMNSDNRKPGSIYANNFGAADQARVGSQETTVNVESVIIDLILKPFVNRLIDMQDEIMNQENLYLYSDIRTLFSYIKEHHGSIFRKVAFSNMLEPLVKLKQENQERDSKLRAVDEKLSDLEQLHELIQQQMAADLLEYRKQAEPEEGLVMKRVNLEPMESCDNGSSLNPESDSLASSPRKDLRNGNEPPVVPSSNASKYSDLWPLRLAHLRKINTKRHYSVNHSDSKQSSQDSELSHFQQPGYFNDKHSPILTANAINSGSSKRLAANSHSVSSSTGNFLTVTQQAQLARCSPTVCTCSERATVDELQVNLGGEGSPNMAGANKSRKSEMLSLTARALNQKRQHWADSKWSHALHSESKQWSTREQQYTESLSAIHHLQEQTLQQRRQLLAQRLPVDMHIVYRGIEHYRFLGECLPPGCVPDVPFMSALLELESPLISKAAFLLETAYFVNRCNRKDWPNWIKMNIGPSVPARSTRASSFNSFQQTTNPVKRNKVFQLAASNMFLAWGEVLANKLEQILDRQEAHNPTSCSAESTLSADDFFDESLVNPDGNNCPFALQNIVCILLLEITAFLRETYQYMPKKIAHTEPTATATFNRMHPQHSQSQYSQASHNKETNSRAVAENESAFFEDLELTSKVSKDLKSADGTGLLQKRLSRVEFVNRKMSTDNVSLRNDLERLKHLSLAPENSNNGSDQHPASKRISFKIAPKTDLSPPDSTTTIPDNSATAPTSITGAENQSVGSLRSSSTNSSQKRKNVHMSFKKASLKIKGLTRLTRSGRSADSDTAPPADSVEPEPNYHSGVSFTSHTDSSHQQQQDFCEVDDIDYNAAFPWIRIVVKILGKLHTSCAGQEASHLSKQATEDSASGSSQASGTRLDVSLDCYLKQFKSGHSLVEAVLRMYELAASRRQAERVEREERAREVHKKSSSLRTASSRKKQSSMSRQSSGVGRHRNKQESDQRLPSNKQKQSRLERMHYFNSLLQQKKSTAITAQLVPATTTLANTLPNDGSFQTATANKELEASAAKGQSSDKERRDRQRRQKPAAIVSFVHNHVQTLNQMPLLVLCKGLLVMPDECFVDLVPIVWQLLLNADQDMASAAATLFIIGAIKQPLAVEELLKSRLRDKCPQERCRALLKFEVLWKFRYHVWPRLEANAHNLLKISPPCIEFVLPSPAIGVGHLQTADAPWQTRQSRTKADEVTANQSEVKRAVVTASKSRKKHHQEVVDKAHLADKLARKTARENFRITNVAYLPHAAHESLIHQTRADDLADEVTDENGNQGAASFAAAADAGDLQQSQPVFPSAISTAVVHLIDLLDDSDLDASKQAIGSLAHRIVHACLIEDTALFLRHIFERITQRERQQTLVRYLRVLLSAYVDLPPQTAYTLFNYLLGIVMYFVRLSAESSQEAVASLLTLVWRIVRNVTGIVFKDLKQLLKKEQCEPSLLITANVPSAKKLIVHGPDLSQIPTQSAISEDTQFLNILHESFEFFGIPEARRDKHFLVDVKTSQIHVPDTYVRNFYFFKRNHTPQLSLVQMEPRDAIRLLERSAFYLKTWEESKVLLFRQLIDKASPGFVGAVSSASAAFLHEELLKLPMFPRKPLEADFNLYARLPDRELLTTDMLHKYSWCQLIWSLFASMDSKTASTWDLTSFLHVINGSFLLHADDFNMIRACLAIYINAARHFQHVFATNGFLIILPTLLRVYANSQANPIVSQAVEFTCTQFYTIHRIPFVLQLFGSVAPLLDATPDHSDLLDTNKIQASCFLNILLAMESSRSSSDDLKIMDLVNSRQQSLSQTTKAQAFSSHPMSSLVSAQNLSSSFYSVTDDKAFNNPNAVAGLEAAFVKVNPTSSSGTDSSNAGNAAVANLVNTNNLLISSSGALDCNQIYTLSTLSNNTGNGLTNSGPNGTTSAGQLELETKTTRTVPATTITTALSDSPLTDPLAAPTGNQNPYDLDFKSIINGVEFTYLDEVRFTLIDTVNICVTVVVYASHASRANQMLTILDAILPRYMRHMKAETDKVLAMQQANLRVPGSRHRSSQNSHEVAARARQELLNIQKLACALKTLVNTTDYLTRVYNGPKNEQRDSSVKKGSLNKNKSGAGIQPDDDSIKLSDDKVQSVYNRPSKSTGHPPIDEKQMRSEFRSPRDFLLNIMSEFVHFASGRIKELYKLANDSTLKITELLDTKTNYKLVEIANALLKLWDDSCTLNGNGLQNYFMKLVPVNNWSENDIKPAFSNLLRRVERLFTKISKRSFAKRQLDWTAVAGILNGLCLALGKNESLAKIPYFKLLINSAISLVLNETSPSDASNTAVNTSHSFLAQLSATTSASFQCPLVYSKALIQLVGKYTSALKDQANMEQFYCSLVGTNQMNAPLAMPTGLSYLVNFLMPLLFYSASDCKNSPKLNSCDMTFVCTLLLNSLKPPSKLAATLLLQAPKQHHLTAFDAPGGIQTKNSKHMKDVISQSTFLAFKLVTYAFYKQIDLTRIAFTIRQIFNKPKTIFFWRFLDFTCTNKTPLFLLIKPFVEAFVASQDCDTEQEQTLRLSILSSLNCSLPTDCKSKNDVLAELLTELKAIQAEIQDSMKTQQKSSPHMDLMKKLSDTGGSLKRGLSMRLKSKLTRQDTRAKEDAAETDARKRLSISTDTYGDLEGAARPERHQSLFVDGQTSRVLGLLKNPLVGKLASASSSKRRMMLPRLRMSSLDTERLPDCLVEQEDDRVRLLSRSVQARAKLWRLNAIQLPSVDVEEQVENEGLAATGDSKAGIHSQGDPSDKDIACQVDHNNHLGSQLQTTATSPTKTFDLRAKKLMDKVSGFQNSPAQPRKKFEKLCSKSGIDILEVYKSKNSKKFADSQLIGEAASSPVKKASSPLVPAESVKSSRSDSDFVPCQQSEVEPNGHELSTESTALIAESVRKKKILFV